LYLSSLVSSMKLILKDNENTSILSSKMPYRSEIDGLRALAVVSVIINHFNKKILPSGYLGVDIFFTISGFVITASLTGRPDQKFGDFMVGFYTKRIKRLMPALILYVAILSVIICLFNPSPGEHLQTGITALFGFSNLFLLSNSTDYFATSTELNPFTHTWSLGVEEQF
jgi:peptidoglycan/LPS O-acetylase OafA/YrhL